MITVVKRLFSSFPSSTAPTQQLMMTILSQVSLSSSTDPGFVRFDSIDSLEPSTIPLEIRDLFVNRSHHMFNVRYRPLLSKLTNAQHIPYAMRFYENQEDWNKITVVTGKTASFQDQSYKFQPDGSVAEIYNPIEFPSNEVQPREEELVNENKSISLLLMSILKWRKRMMRGHKYKKRMKKLRRKAKNNQ